jgi:hypothetical protein
VRRGGLTVRVLVASGLLALIVGGAFTLVVRAVTLEHDSAQLSADSRQALATADSC